MSLYKSDFLRIANEKGFIHQCTDYSGLDKLLASNSITAYVGFDCTAPSLHAGSLVSIMLLRLFQKCGHKPIVLLGGGTTKVGDPSGKEETRQLINDQNIRDNMKSIKDIFKQFLSFDDSETSAQIVNNADWLDNLKYIKFLREFGQHFSVNKMINFDSVKLRLNRQQSLSFLEFNYMVLQAYDFFELSRRMNCRLQMGGSDQWGNIVNGIELARRIDQTDIYGLTTLLLTTSSGAKMGKTADGAIWLNEDFLTPYNYWQYWRNTEDSDVFRFFKLFTDLTLGEIKAIKNNPEVSINDAKKRLADEITALCHGEEAANKARITSETTFEQGGYGNELPVFHISKTRLKNGIPAFQLFFETNLSNSGGEARRLIKGGGGKVNGVLISDETQSITDSNINTDGLIKLSAGKKRHVLINVT